MGCVPSLPKVVRLVWVRRERALVEAQVVVRFPSVGLLSFRDEAADLIRIAKARKSLIVRRLIVVVDLTTLFVLSQCEVVAFKFGDQTQVFILLCLSCHIGALDDELRVGLGDWLLSLSGRADSDICSLQLGSNLTPVCSSSSGLCLFIDL